MRKFLYNLWRPIFIWWSNFYWRKAVTDYILQADDHKEKDETISHYILRMAQKLLDRFEYTTDGWEQLGDSIPPPPEAYRQYAEGTLKDDCDGFHSALYHIAHCNGVKCELVSVLSTKNHYGHCILLFYDDEWKVCDYKTLMLLPVAKKHYNKVTENKFVEHSIIYDYKKKKLINQGESAWFQ